MSTPSQIQSAVKTATEKLGIRHAADHFGVSYESLKSVHAGLKVRAGTLALIEAKLGDALPEPKPRKTRGKAKAKPATKAKPAKKAKAKKVKE